MDQSSRDSNSSWAGQPEITVHPYLFHPSGTGHGSVERPLAIASRNNRRQIGEAPEIPEATRVIGVVVVITYPDTDDRGLAPANRPVVASVVGGTGFNRDRSVLDI